LSSHFLHINVIKHFMFSPKNAQVELNLVFPAEFTSLLSFYFAVRLFFLLIHFCNLSIPYNY
jgi:hypothetical protein